MKWLTEVAWVAILDNGEKIIGYDGNEWLELKNNKHSIVELKLKFRTHIISPLPKNQDGYFFGKSCTFTGGNVTHSCIIGYLQDNKLYKFYYLSPFLTLFNQNTTTTFDERLIYAKSGVRKVAE